MINSISYQQPIMNFKASKKEASSSVSEKNVKNNVTTREILAYTVAATSAGMLIKNRCDINKYAKLINEKAPKTMSGLVNSLGKSATIDGMTQLGNKTNFNINSIKDYNKAMASGKNFSIGMLDMDNFKSINEVFNHTTGDDFLKKIAKNAKDVAQKHGAKSYRYGGEEFVITATNKTPEEMKNMMEEISSAIKKDNGLQDYLPEFKKKSSSHLKEIEVELGNAQQNIFDKFKNPLSIKEAVKTKQYISSFLENYVEKFDPIDRTSIEHIQKLLNVSNEELPQVLKANTKVGTQTLSVSLDRLVAPYREMRNDLLKWSNHIKRHGAFTISGGYKTLTPDTKFKFNTSESLVGIADLSLQSSKTTGKNTMTEATEDILKLVANNK